MDKRIPDLSNIKQAHQRIDKYIWKTPVFTSHYLDELTGAKVFMKCENFQKVGAFKMRGATNKILSYRPEERVNGFATHSSGNHAQAVALAAKLAGAKAYIVMPEDASQVKKDAVEEYGAEVVYCKPNEQARQITCDELIKRTGAIYVPPFNDSEIIAGQATATKELMEDYPDLDYIVTPVGGGGLAAGTALITHYISPNTKVILGEPEAVDDTYQSFRSGVLTPVGKKKSVADGLLTTVGDLNFEIIKQYVDDVVPVSEAAIVDAMRMIWERVKIIIEPSSAVAIAALLKNEKRFEGKRVGIIITGGNVNLKDLPF